MKYYKKCKGCGLDLQDDDKNKEGYVPNLEFEICQNCFRSKNYGEFNNNLSIFYDINEISEIKNDNVIMIIDALNPFDTMIDNINKYVSSINLTIIVNKIDIFPKSVSHDSIILWIADIADKKGIEFNQISLVSSFKNINIDSISSFILNSTKNTSIIGYSNVGKSSIIKSLFNSIGVEINNLVTNSIGTTKEIIELNYKDKIIKDYPGIILNGSYQNIMDIKQLKETHPQKEIKITTFQLNEHQTISIGDYAYFSIKKQNNKLGYQFTFSNLVKLHRSKYKDIPNMINHKIKHRTNKKYDLIISGLGIVTFKSNNQELFLSLPEGVNFILVNSLYN